MKTDQEIFNAAIEEYGVIPQMVVTMEEMAELTQALSKRMRGKDNIDNIAEEVADVQIMINQIKVMFGIEDWSQQFYEDKVKRLKERLEKSL